MGEQVLVLLLMLVADGRVLALCVGDDRAICCRFIPNASDLCVCSSVF